MKRAGERAFVSSSDASKSDEDLEGAEPRVSILPVPSKGLERDRTEAEGAQEAIADAILGRGEEEVRDALERAESENIAGGEGHVHGHDHGSASNLKGGEHVASMIAHEEL